MEALSAIERFGSPRAGAIVIDHDASVLASHGDTRTPFPLASVTKLLTAYAAFVAVEEGILALDESAGPVGSTLRHLLSHASGLSPLDRRVVLAPPGQRRIYSNAGMEVIGDLVASHAEMDFATYVREGVTEPLEMGATSLEGSPAAGGVSTVEDLGRFAAELVRPKLVSAELMAIATTVAFPGLSGVLPGFGRQSPCDWGLGFELKSSKVPHWTGRENAPETFGHFGQSGTFLLVDPIARYALCYLGDRPFGPWAAELWPPFCDAVAREVAAARAGDAQLR